MTEYQSYIISVDIEDVARIQGESYSSIMTNIEDAVCHEEASYIAAAESYLRLDDVVIHRKPVRYHMGTRYVYIINRDPSELPLDIVENPTAGLFLQRSDIPRNILRSLLDSLNCQGLDRLTIIADQFVDTEDSFVHPNLFYLRYLSLKASLVNLYSMGISSLIHLRSLSLNVDEVINSDIKPLIEPLQCLVILRIAGNMNLSNLGQVIISEYLQILDVSQSEMEQVPLPSNIEHLYHLHTLRVRSISQSDFMKIARLPRLFNYHCTISLDTTHMSHLGNIRSLSFIDVYEEDSARYSFVAMLPHLRWIMINGITYDGRSLTLSLSEK